ncbi:hypothetical protein [Pedobacter sp. R20-19]|uniref:hypothetical protein n=1 Tax=Pedobacter sp. R20-19 TaxID=1270196 RepID=UPI000A58EE29|nr:hypothetical protein [Pedobacter sp. R20-19]
MNYLVIGTISFLVLLLIIFLIKRNIKDKKQFEEEVLDAEMPVEKSEKEIIKI